MVRILDVSECLDLIDSLASWNSDYWSDRTPEVDIDQWCRFYQECADGRGLEIPVTLVGLEDGMVFGGVTIVEVDDIHDFPNYSPWIAAVIVGKAFRGKSLGLVLMNAALAKVRPLGFEEVFLWTNSRDEWYRQRGWIEIHRRQIGKVKAVIMKKEI
jgi:GNAT superfamily N-acetyltransferase